jgi:ADP-ribosylglycohydrolase/uridine kinase
MSENLKIVCKMFRETSNPLVLNSLSEIEQSVMWKVSKRFKEGGRGRTDLMKIVYDYYFLRYSDEGNGVTEQCNTSREDIIKDKIRGTIMGHATGDALGAPHENSPFGSYTGRLEVPIVRKAFYGGPKVSTIGQVTDDTEMAMALMWSLENGFDRDETIFEYVKWASNKVGRSYAGFNPFIGVNTKALLTSSSRDMTNKAKLVDEYHKKFNQYNATDEDRESRQTNGSLMRSYPLAFVNPVIIEQEVSITGPSRVAIEAVHVYTVAIRMAIQGFSKKDILGVALESVTHQDLRTALDQAMRNEFRNVTNLKSKEDRTVVSESRGWLVHGFYCAFWGLLQFNDYAAAMDKIICLSSTENRKASFCSGAIMKENEVKEDIGDTDTNAAIAGALIGAYYGYSRMIKNPVTRFNMDTVKKAKIELRKSVSNKIPRPARYTMSRENRERMVNIALRLYDENFGREPLFYKNYDINSDTEDSEIVNKYRSDQKDQEDIRSRLGIPEGQHLVIGISGASRSGKSWVAEKLVKRLGLVPEALIGQDAFWFKNVKVMLDGQKVDSSEEPEGVNHEELAETIENVKHISPVVIVEGYVLLHNEEVRNLLTHIWVFEIPRDVCIERRSQKKDRKLNRTPKSVEDCENFVWPAHERYMERSVDPLGFRVRRLNGPSNEQDVDSIIDIIIQTDIDTHR